ncbi:O-antigen ligase family protein [Tessaracoccus sp. MC1679]|uniref:O-antigen ligase family protein n=1 Tax=Tessaracoccus sp. MC1679 TaxID=2760313 RepID=UPI0016032D0B|nr:O-antigen ligase family protein [Tessaracoccus sp. MC1679]MBB1514789.1 O-antigen ligase family protein [Tessaracoccus sp. MC1679]
MDSSAPLPARSRQWLDRAARVLVALLPTLATVALYLPKGALMPSRLAVLALLALGVGSVWIRRRLDAPRTAATTIMVFGVMLGFGALSWARFPEPDLAAFSHAAFIAAAALATALTVVRLPMLHVLVAGWAVSAALAAAIGYWEVVTGSHLPGNLPAQKYDDVIPGWNVISSFFDNPNLYGYHCAVVLVLLPLAYQLAQGWLRPGVIVLGVLVSGALYWSSSRMGLVAAVVGLVVWALTRRWSVIVMLLSAVTVGVTALAGWPPGRTIAYHVRQLTENLQWGELTSSGSRLQLIRTGWWMTGESGYLGVGPGHFATWAASPNNPYPSGLVNPHSGVVEVMAEYGLISLATLGVGALAAVLLCVRALARLPMEASAARASAWCSIALVASLPFVSHTHSSWLSQPLTMVHIATITGLLAFVESATRELIRVEN